MADEVELFCGRLYRNNPNPSGLVLAGASGVAKTHCLNRVVAFWARAAFSSFDKKCWSKRIPNWCLLRWPETIDQLKAGNLSIVEDAVDADLLLLDDIGAENDPWQAGVDKLCQILSRRERKFTMITTNVDCASWQTQWDSRVADRLLRNSVVVDLFEVESWAIQSRL